MGQSAGVFADFDPDVGPVWSRLPEAMNGIINSRQTTPPDDTAFSLIPCRLLSAGTIIFVDVCFLITVVPCSRGHNVRSEFIYELQDTRNSVRLKCAARNHS